LLLRRVFPLLLLPILARGTRFFRRSGWFVTKVFGWRAFLNLYLGRVLLLRCRGGERKTQKGQ
jgi:hypothetical protein